MLPRISRWPKGWCESSPLAADREYGVDNRRLLAWRCGCGRTHGGTGPSVRGEFGRGDGAGDGKGDGEGDREVESIGTRASVGGSGGIFWTGRAGMV